MMTSGSTDEPQLQNERRTRDNGKTGITHPAFGKNHAAFRNSRKESGTGLAGCPHLLDQTAIMRAKKDQNLRLSANLRWLQQQGTSLAALGKKISTPTSTISAWSNGAIPTDHSALLRLAKNLDCSLERLLFGDLSVSEKPAQVDLNELFSGKFVVEIKARKLPSDQ